MVVIPDWMDKEAPGAADAARAISLWDLSDIQQHRLERLISDRTQSVWRELRREISIPPVDPWRTIPRRKELLSEDQLRSAQHALLFEAFRAPDFPPIGRIRAGVGPDRSWPVQVVGAKAKEDPGPV
jgi:hypothetical protein